MEEPAVIPGRVLQVTPLAGGREEVEDVATGERWFRRPVFVVLDRTTRAVKRVVPGAHEESNEVTVSLLLEESAAGDLLAGRSSYNPATGAIEEVG